MALLLKSGTSCKALESRGYWALMLTGHTMYELSRETRKPVSPNRLRSLSTRRGKHLQPQLAQGRRWWRQLVWSLFCLEGKVSWLANCLPGRGDREERSKVNPYSPKASRESRRGYTQHRGVTERSPFSSQIVLAHISVIYSRSAAEPNWTLSQSLWYS